MLSAAAVALLAFGALLPLKTTSSPYLLFPFLIWAALRFGQHGAVTATFVVSIIAIWSTAHGLGPFARQTLHESLLLLQTFMSVAAATILVLAADVTERRQLEEKLRQRAEELVRAVAGG